MLRTEVGRQTGIRHTPSLAFVADAIPETARHLDDLLRQAEEEEEREEEGHGGHYPPVFREAFRDRVTGADRLSSTRGPRGS